MILVLSDGGENAAEIEKQLKKSGEKYLFYFADFMSAARSGKGNVIVGEPRRHAVLNVIKDNKVTAIIDAVKKPASKLSKAALLACGGDVRYVKFENIKGVSGAEICLSYREVADRIKSIAKNTLVYAHPFVVSEIARLAGEKAKKIYAPIAKSAVFDVKAALEYGIPLANVFESEATDTVSRNAERVDAGMVVCDGKVCSTEKAVCECRGDIPVILTCSSGIDFPKTVMTAHDAVMAACGK